MADVYRFRNEAE